VNPGDGQRAIAELKTAGARFVSSADLRDN